MATMESATTEEMDGLRARYEELMSGEDAELGALRGGLARLWRSLEAAWARDRARAESVRALALEVSAHHTKMQSLVNVSKNDQGTIRSLKGEIKGAWEAMRAMRAKEVLTLSRVKELEEQLEKLTSTEAAAATRAREAELASLQRAGEELQRTLEATREEKRALASEVDGLRLRHESLMRGKELLEGDLLACQARLVDGRERLQQEALRRERLEAKLNELRTGLDGTATEGRLLAFQLGEKKKELEERDTLVTRLSEEQAVATRRLGETGARLAQTERRLAEMGERNLTLEEEARGLRDSLAARAAALARAAEEKRAAEIRLEGLRRRAEKLDKEKGALQATRASQKQALAALETQVEKLSKDCFANEKSLELLTREKNTLQKQLARGEEADRTLQTATRLAEQQRDAQARALGRYKEENEALQAKLEGAQARRARVERDLGEAEARREALGALVGTKQGELQTQERLFAALKVKIAQQKSMYEAAKTERALLARQLQGAEAALATAKRETKTLSQQAESLKQELQARDAKLLQAHVQSTQYGRDCVRLRETAARKQEKLAAMADASQKQREEMLALKEALERTEQEKAQSTAALASAEHEKRQAAAQLLMRKQELAALTQRVNVQEALRAKGERDWEARTKEMTALQEACEKLEARLRVEKAKQGAHAALQREKNDLERQLLNERVAVKALADELAVPTHVHRWRLLESTDEQAFQTVKQVQHLQTELLKKTEQLYAKEAEMAAKETEIAALRKQTNRKPLAELQTKLSAQQTELQAKAAQLKTLKVELLAAQQNADQAKDALNLLQGEFALLRKKTRTLKPLTKEELAIVEKEKREAAEATTEGGAAGGVSSKTEHATEGGSSENGIPSVSTCTEPPQADDGVAGVAMDASALPADAGHDRAAASTAQDALQEIALEDLADNNRELTGDTKTMEIKLETGTLLRQKSAVDRTKREGIARSKSNRAVDK